MPLPLQPDIVALTREALLAQSTLTAQVSTRIYDRLPGSAAQVYPLLVVTSVDSGESDEPTIGDARVQVDVWGRPLAEVNARSQAWTVTATLISVIRDLRGTWTAGKIVNSALLNTIPQPDDTSGRTRYIVDLQITPQA